MTIRRGVTLFELVLVLVVLVLIGVVAWPALERPFAAGRLRHAGDQVCTAWARARNQAMVSGEICLFYYQTGGGQYYAQQGGEMDAFAAPLVSGFEAAAAGGAGAAPIVQQLPEGIVFAEGTTTADPRVAGFGTAQTPTTSVDLDLAQWSQPVVFFPDGTATSAQLTLSDKYGFRILVEIRGVTGSSSTSDVTSDQQVTP